MYNVPYFMPNFYVRSMPGMMRGSFMRANAFRGSGLFQKIGQGIGALKSIHWGGIINNTSKTLGVINQAIPLVKQVGPVMNNMRSMLKVASVFKDETDNKTKSSFSNGKKPKLNDSVEKVNMHYGYEDYSPTFFIG